MATGMRRRGGGKIAGRKRTAGCVFVVKKRETETIRRKIKMKAKKCNQVRRRPPFDGLRGM